MEQRDYPGLLRSCACEIGVDLNENQVRQFMVYLSELKKWNATINLTGIVDPAEIIVKHFVDSLLGLVAWDFKPESLLCDVGTGAGFPGIPIKIARPDLRVALVEPNKKKCSFVQYIAGALQLSSVVIHPVPFDRFAQDRTLSQVDTVTLRALRFETVSRDVKKVLGAQGVVMLFRAEQYDDSMIKRHFVLERETEFVLPLQHGHRVISVLRPIST